MVSFLRGGSGPAARCVIHPLALNIWHNQYSVTEKHLGSIKWRRRLPLLSRQKEMQRRQGARKRQTHNVQNADCVCERVRRTQEEKVIHSARWDFEHARFHKHK